MTTCLLIPLLISCGTYNGRASMDMEGLCAIAWLVVRVLFFTMANRRFQRAVADMGRKEFLQTVKQSQKTRPEGMRIPQEVLVPPKDWKKARDIPFVAGDRVQITNGEHKNKVGQILYKYPFGNAFAINGIPGEKMVNSIETKLQVGADDYEAVSDTPKVFDVKDLRLVSTVRTAEGREQDVAIHSLKLGAEEYDPVSNQHRRVRTAEFDDTIRIPWPTSRVQPVDEAKVESQKLTTTAPVADTRTHYVMSVLDPPMPRAAIDQITNLNNRFRRSRYAPKITAKDVEKYSAPKMPLNPRTRKMLADIAAMPKPEQPSFTPEMEEFISAEIKKGLAKRVDEEKAALKQYT